MIKALYTGVLLALSFTSPILAEEKPNFVIVLADDVAWSSFGCTESGLFTRTPNIDKLATQAVRFTNFHGAVAQCGPLRHELYTGTLPPTSGIYSNGSKPKPGLKSVVNFMEDLGYNIALTGKEHFSNSTTFQKIPGFSGGANDSEPTWEMDGVKEYIKASQAESKPFCVVIGSVHAHHPWTVGDKSNFPLDKIVVPPHMVDTPVTREALAIHAAEVEVLDEQVGATMKLINDMDLTENTVFIFLSEQGTAMPNGKWSIYDYGTKALCLVSWPGKLQAAVTDAVAMYCDIVPTMVDMAGGEAPAVDGKSFYSVLKGETSVHRDHAFLVHQAGGYAQRAIRTKEYKLIWNPKQDIDYYLEVMMDPQRAKSKFFAKTWQEWLSVAKTDSAAQEQVDRVVKHPEFELYNVKNDPWELNNLATNPEYASVVKEMHAQLKADMDKMNDEFSTADPKAAKKAKKAKQKEQGEDPKKKKSAKKKGSDSDQSNKADKKKKREKKKENK